MGKGVEYLSKYHGKSTTYHHCEKRIYPGAGLYDFPELDPVDVDVDGVELVAFNSANSCAHPEDKICHFYVDDHHFDRVWSNPDKYIPIFKRFKAVLSPDFSMYTDWPMAVQIFNNYRKQWCAAYWQEHGIPVIPTIGWSTHDSYEWCFDGVPKHSLVCISTVGGFGNHENNNKRLWLDGYYKCLEVLKPSKILLYGRQYPEVKFDGPIIVASDVNIIRKKTLSANPAKEDGFKLPAFNGELLEDNDADVL